MGFGPTSAAALFGLSELSDVRASRSAYYDALVLPHDPAGDAARFFVLHDAVPEERLRAWLGDDVLRFLEEMAAVAVVGAQRRSVIGLTWFAGRLIATDARAYNVVWPGDPFAEYVMPPGGDSVGLMKVAPRARRSATLDLCCGAGAQALAAAGQSGRVVGVDVNPRALRFAAFNAVANRIENAAFVRGDCYEPLGTARFEAIVANPPFVPRPEADALLYRGGGPLGDEVVARILAGAVDHLERPGSLALCADLANVATLPERIRTWQGQDRRTLVMLQTRYDLLAYAESHAAHLPEGSAREAELVRLMRHFRESGIETLHFGYIVQNGEPGEVSVQTVPSA